jgi:anti-sigma28 factor (negative regulator of flagellin synthesis)
MKIDDPNLTGTSASAPRTQESLAVTRTETTEAGASQRSEGADRVEWSRLTGKVAQALAAQGRARAARVEGLAREVQSGRYQVSAGEAGRALVREMLSAGVGQRSPVG